MVENIYRLRFLIAICIAAGAFFNAPVVEASAENNSTSSACLLKYDSLSRIMCETKPEREGDILGMVAPITNATATDSATPQENTTKEKQDEKKLGVKEVKGVKKEYVYTDRVVKGQTKYYTMTREKPDVKSERVEALVNGDKVRAIKLDETKEWYFVEIFKSHDPELEGTEGWIETWLIDDENVPVKPSPTPTKAIPTPSAEEAATQTAQASVAASSGEGEQLFSMVNNYRTSNGLPPFQKSERLCSIARTRAPEIAGEVATGSIHAGFYNRGYGYPDVENAVGMGSVDANFNWWINSGLHRGSILGPDLTYSCLECSGGNCVQIFSSQP